MNTHTISSHRPAAAGAAFWWRLAGVLALLALAAWIYTRYKEPIDLLIAWTPGLLASFVLNIVMGLVAIAVATVGGTALGIAQCSPHRRRATLARQVTLLLRNAPWLVAVFYLMYLVPYEIHVFGKYVFVSDWLKAAIGIGVPASGYMSEIVRGGIRSIPLQQWEAASALAWTGGRYCAKWCCHKPCAA